MMSGRINFQKKIFFHPVIFCLLICFNLCLSQHYDYADYSYRNARDYQYEEDYGDDYDKTGQHVPKWNTLSLRNLDNMNAPNEPNAPRKHEPHIDEYSSPVQEYQAYQPQIGRSGDFVASPPDPGMSFQIPEERTFNRLLTPHDTSPYRPVYFQGAYRGTYLDRMSKMRKRRRQGVNSRVRNSPLYKAGNKILGRIVGGTRKVFFKNNQGGISGSSYNSPSYGYPGQGSGFSMKVMGNDITKFLLPLAAISLVALPTLATLTGLPYASIVFPFGSATSSLGRKKRSTLPFQRETNVKDMKIEQEIDILEDFWAQQPLEERKNQVDMIMANYVSCSGVEGTVFDESDQYSVENHCLEHIACLYGNEKSPLSNAERNVVAVVLHNMLVNKYISDVLKQKLEDAMKIEPQTLYSNNPGNICDQYQCTMVFQPKKDQPKTDPTKHYFIRTFDNHLTDNGKGNEYLNQTTNEKHRNQRVRTPKSKRRTEKRELQYVPEESKSHSSNEHVLKTKEANQASVEDYVFNDDVQKNDNSPDFFGPDPRFPPFPTFPSFPNFPEFPETKKN